MWRMKRNAKQAELELQLAAAQRQAEAYLAALRQTNTDFAEYRRRVDKNRAEDVTLAQIKLLEQLLPVLDDLGRALRAAPTEYAASSWVQGLLLVAKQLTSVLSGLGMERYGGGGTIFDPRYHDVLSTEVRPDLPEGTILHVTKLGYAFAGRIVRAAQVIVSLPG